MIDGNVIWLFVNSLLLLVCVIVLYEGIRDFSSEEFQRDPFTFVLIIGGVVGIAASAYFIVKYFGIVLAEWNFAEAMQTPVFTDWTTLGGVFLAILFILGAFWGLWKTATYRLQHKQELQQVR